MPYILIGLFSYWFACQSRITTHVAGLLFKLGFSREVRLTANRTGRTPIRIRPFDCEKCLAFWLALTYGLLTEPSIFVLIYAGCSSLLAITSTFIINKIR